MRTTPATSRIAGPSARSPLLAVGLVSVALALGCSDEPSPTAPAPVAGLQHVEVAAVGAAVRFSAANTAVAASAGAVATPGTQIVRFEFTIADGSGTQATAAPTLEHRFDAPGSYAVKLRVVDDLGRGSEVASTIAVLGAVGESCTANETSACDSARCSGGACLAIACAGEAACPSDLVCSAARCVLADRVEASGDQRYGADGERATLDALP